ncbi:MAG: hypothetical protein VKJ24_12755 [Synechococcales bacterium]|nr:hypothetical protein [Synechococcales bacterium]
MERGLLWLPLLGLFFWLAWAGWNEYQKVEGYRVWAQSFDRAKYDILAALGQKGDRLTWGKPTRKGLLELQTLDLTTVQQIQLRVDGKVANLTAPPEQGKQIFLECLTDQATVQIPFTEVAIAAQWVQALQKLDR